MKLKYRLSFAFVAVVALGAVMMFFLVQRTSEAAFRSYVFSGDSAKARVYASLAGEYYRDALSWSDAQGFLRDLPLRLQGSTGSTFRDLLADRIVIVDANGIIVADTAGQLVGTVHPHRHIAHGMPVIVDSRQEGTVLVGSMIDSALTGESARYLAGITASLALSTALSVCGAILLGVLLATRMTRPLASLAMAAKAVASGTAVILPPGKGDDEIADLSRSFRAMVESIKKLDAAKRQVVADSAHELRTPVTLIRGLIEGMMDGVYPLEMGTLASVHEETIRLSRLIDTLRELEIIESGELRLEQNGVPLGEMLERAAVLFAPQAAEKSIRILLLPSGDTESFARGDRVRLDEVLYNLVSNAIKYTPPGGTVLLGRFAGEGASPGEGFSPGDGIASGQSDRCGFSVEDSGPGIAENERTRIFERFYRIDKSRATDSGGRGLGLAIAAEIIKAHGGSITVGVSSLGGARFSVMLPRA